MLKSGAAVGDYHGLYDCTICSHTSFCKDCIDAGEHQEHKAYLIKTRLGT